MTEIDPTYAKVLAQLIAGAATNPEDERLFHRLHHHGLRIEGRTISTLDGSEMTDPIALDAVRRFVEGTSKASQLKPMPWHIRRDLDSLCDSIQMKKLRAAAQQPSPSAPTTSAAAAAVRFAIPKNPSAPAPEPAAMLPGDELPSVRGEFTAAITPPITPEAINSVAPAPVADSTAAESVQKKEALPDESRVETAVPPRLKPATWQKKEPTGPWCPEIIGPHLGFNIAYEHSYQREEPASPGWHIVAATQRGRMHAHHGTHREDAFDFCPDQDFTIVCVSDGAGSYEHSRIGSESTCRKVVRALAATLDSRRAELTKLSPDEFNLQLQTAIGEAVQSACTFLHELAAKTDTKPKDFRCTLVLGVLWLAGDTPLLVFSQVGDGFMAGQGKEGRAQRYGESDSGAFSGEVNCFIPDPDAVRNAQHVIAIGAANADAFIFCSDGIEDPFYPTEKKSQIIFQQLRDGVSESLEGFEKQERHGPVIGTSEAKARLAAWLDFEKKGENDDRTILILHRSPSQLIAALETTSGSIAKAESSAETAAPAVAPTASEPV